MNRPVMSSRWLSALALASICACTASAPVKTDDESARIAPIVEKYKKQDVLTGFDVKGTTLVVFADTEKYSELDDSVEASMKSELLDTWARAWKSDHPRSHAKLRLIFQNYYGQEMARLTRSV